MDCCEKNIVKSVDKCGFPVEKKPKHKIYGSFFF